jgi:hypothetical protein
MKKNYHGYITKRGSTILRNALVQIAMGMIKQWSGKKQCNNILYSLYKNISARTSDRKR